MKEIYYNTDFKLEENGEDFKKPFRYRYYCKHGNNIYDVSFDGVTYKNCKVNENGGLVVYFVNHNMGVGQLICEKLHIKENKDGTHTWEKSHITEYKIYLVAVPVAIRAEENDNGGVNLYNVDAKVVGHGVNKAVILRGNLKTSISKDTGEVTIY